MKRVLLTVVILLSLASGVYAQAKQQQFYGTHVFFEKPSDFFFSDAIQFSYVKRDFSFMLSSFRTLESITDLIEELDSGEAKKTYLEDTNSFLFIVETVYNGKNLKEYVIPIGDETESALVVANVLQEQNLANSEQEIYQIFKTLRWQPESDLNFEEVYFFEDIEFGNLNPVAILGDRIVFTINGENFVSNPLVLYIGRSFVFDRKGEEDKIFDAMLAMELGDDANTISDKKKMIINGLLCISAKGESKEQTLYYSLFFDNNVVYFIGEELSAGETNTGLVDYQGIVSSFKIKR